MTGEHLHYWLGVDDARRALRCWDVAGAVRWASGFFDLDGALTPENLGYMRGMTDRLLAAAQGYPVD